jgi:hypothetical protein
MSSLIKKVETDKCPFRDPKVKGGSCKDDICDTRDEWWVGKTLRQALRLR